MEQKPELTGAEKLAEALQKVEATRRERRARLIAGGLIAPVEENWKPDPAGARKNANFLEPRQTPEKDSL